MAKCEIFIKVKILTVGHTGLSLSERNKASQNRNWSKMMESMLGSTNIPLRCPAVKSKSKLRNQAESGVLPKDAAPTKKVHNKSEVFIFNSFHRKYGTNQRQARIRA